MNYQKKGGGQGRVRERHRLLSDTSLAYAVASEMSAERRAGSSSVHLMRAAIASKSCSFSARLQGKMTKKKMEKNVEEHKSKCREFKREFKRERSRVQESSRESSRSTDVANANG